MTDLYLCVDPGSSQTKIIYQLNTQESPKYLLMPPDIESIEKLDLDLHFSLKGWMGYPAPIRQSWLEFGDKVYVVGAFASSFDPVDHLGELKYENAIYKVLAAIGVIQQQHELNVKKKLSVELAVLLPADEFSDRQIFKEKLAKLMLNFKFRGVRMKAKLEKSTIRPEGGGLAAIAIRRNGNKWFHERKVGILMLGHRNISGLYFEHGDIRTYESPLSGFSGFLDSIMAKKSGLSRTKIAEAIFQALTIAGKSIYVANSFMDEGSSTQHPVWKQYEPIQQLATARDPVLRQQELEIIVSSIEIGTRQYWAKVSNWMDKIFPKDLETVIVSGGAAKFLQPEIESYFNCEPLFGYDSSLGKHERDCYYPTGEYKRKDEKSNFTPIIWGTGQEEELSTVFDVKKSEESINYRLVDALGMFERLVDKNFSSKSLESRKEIEVGH